MSSWGKAWSSFWGAAWGIIGRSRGIQRTPQQLFVRAAREDIYVVKQENEVIL